MARWSIEFWRIPANTTISEHYHHFDSWFVKLFGDGAVITKEGRSAYWESYDTYMIPAMTPHGIRTFNSPIIFVAGQSHLTTPMSASDDFVTI